MSSCLVRPATDADAEAAVDVMRRSISESCIADHRNDGTTLERWLSNKTPEQFRLWLGAPDTLMVVAVTDGIVAGVGAIRQSGELELCYVHPSYQGRGVGRALLLALEAQCHTWHATSIQLISTATARAFYERHGYLFRPDESGPGFGVLYYYRYTKMV